MAYNNRMKRGPDHPVEPPSITVPPSGSTVWMSTGNPPAPPKTVNKRQGSRVADVMADPWNMPSWVALMEAERGRAEAKAAFKELRAAISPWTLEEQCTFMAECVKDVWRRDQCESCFSDIHCRVSSADDCS